MEHYTSVEREFDASHRLAEGLCGRQHERQPGPAGRRDRGPDRAFRARIPRAHRRHGDTVTGAAGGRGQRANGPGRVRPARGRDERDAPGRRDARLQPLAEGRPGRLHPRPRRGRPPPHPLDHPRLGHQNRRRRSRRGTPPRRQDQARGVAGQRLPVPGRDDLRGPALAGAELGRAGPAPVRTNRGL